MQVMTEIKKYGLHVYELPPCDEDEDQSFKAKDKQMKASIDELVILFGFLNSAFPSQSLL